MVRDVTQARLPGNLREPVHLDQRPQPRHVELAAGPARQGPQLHTGVAPQQSADRELRRDLSRALEIDPRAASGVAGHARENGGELDLAPDRLPARRDDPTECPTRTRNEEEWPQSSGSSFTMAPP